MEQYLDIASRFWSDFSSWNPPALTMYSIVGFGVLSSWILNKFVAAPPLFSGPICFMILTFAAMISNFIARSYIMMGTSELQKALLFTVIGHAVAGLLLLAIFKVGEKGAHK
jgi:hypothetical protein